MVGADWKIRKYCVFVFVLKSIMSGFAVLLSADLGCCLATTGKCVNKADIWLIKKMEIYTRAFSKRMANNVLKIPQ